MKYSSSERFSWEWSSGSYIPLYNDLLLDNGITFRSLCRYIKSITMHNSCCPLTEVTSCRVRKCIVIFVLAANVKCVSVGQGVGIAGGLQIKRMMKVQWTFHSIAKGRKFYSWVCSCLSQPSYMSLMNLVALSRNATACSVETLNDAIPLCTYN